jgi:hypothetical protein
MTKKNIVHALSLEDPRRQDRWRSNESIELAALMNFDRAASGLKRPTLKVDKPFWKNGTRAISSIRRIPMARCQPTARRKDCVGAMGRVRNGANTT